MADKPQGSPSIKGYEQPLGYFQITGIALPLSLQALAEASALSAVPNCVSKAVIQVDSAGKSCRYRDDGTAPDAATGMELLPTAILEYSGPFSELQFIETAASTILNVSFYK